MSTRTTWVQEVRKWSPPWLLRTVGGAFMEAIAEQIDVLVDRAADGVSHRFPNVVDDSSLAAIGRERRIRRGPGESATTYARRLRSWWDAHRIRGGPYGMLRQLFAYWLDSINPRMDIVYHSGTRRWVDEDGVITRDSITWDADGSSSWSQIWVVFHLAELPVPTGYLMTESGDYLVDDGGNRIVAVTTIEEEGDVSEDLRQSFMLIPREWGAAHLLRTTIVLLYSTARLWNYPQPVPTWTAWSASGATWGGPSPVILTIETGS